MRQTSHQANNQQALIGLDGNFFPQIPFLPQLGICRQPVSRQDRDFACFSGGREHSSRSSLR
jgi:hypothetical protein